MGHVEFPTKRRGVTVDITYGGITDDDVGIDIRTPYGDMGCTLTEKTVAEIHESLGEYLRLRKEERDRKRRSARGVQAAPEGGAQRSDGRQRRGKPG